MAVNIDHWPLRGLPEFKAGEATCTQCKAAQARWELAEGQQVAWSLLCSQCIVARLLQEQPEEMRKYGHALATQLGVQIDLLQVEEKMADRLVVGLALEKTVRTTRQKHEANSFK